MPSAVKKKTAASTPTSPKACGTNNPTAPASSLTWRSRRASTAENEDARKRFSLTTIAGGVGHTLPFLIKDFWLAAAAAAVTIVELLTIAWIQWKYMDTPPVSAAAKVMLGGALALAAGILIGSS